MFHRIVPFLALATMADATCLPGAIPESQRKNITVGGVSMPIGLFPANWDSAFIVVEIFNIVVSEVLGYNVRHVGTTDSMAANYLELGGCKDAAAATMAARECGQPVFDKHVALEMWEWISYLVDGYEASDVADTAPARMGEMNFVGTEGMYVFPQTAERAYVQDGFALVYYRSWNLSWQDPSPYFNNPHDYGFGELSRCSTNWRLTDAGRTQSYIAATGDIDGTQLVDGSRQMRCWNDTWFASTGCRNPSDANDLSKCVPLITGGDGWQAESFLQKISAFNMPIAFAIAGGWTLYTQLPRKYSSLFYWWGPDVTFIDQKPIQLVFPPSKPLEWAQDIKRTGYKENVVHKYISRFLADGYPDVRKVTQRLNIEAPEMQDLLFKLTERRSQGLPGATVHDLTCEWIIASWDRVKKWPPSSTECNGGTGLVDENEDYVFDRSKATSCFYCGAGRYSKAVNLDGETYVCEACSPGYQQASGGQLACAECPAGTFSSKQGATSCELCQRGRYQGQSAMPSCENCPPLMTTLEGGLKTEDDCICPAGFYRPCRDAGNRSNIRSGCMCNPAAYHVATGQMCHPCPDVTMCEAGSDEMNMPCSADDSRQVGNYPKPLPSYYAAYSAPLYLFKCKDDYACPGNGLQICSDNAHGIACGQCDEGYYMNVDGHCEYCGDVFRVPTIPIAIVLLVPCVIAFMYKFGQSDVDQWGSPKYTLFGISYVTLIFLQTLGTNVSIMPAAPVAIKAMFAWTPAIADIMSQFRLSCSTTNDFSAQFVLQISAPSIAALIFFVIYAAFWPSKKYRLNLDVFLGTYGSIFNAFFISVMNLSLSLFQTYPHPNGEWSLRAAPSILKSSQAWQNLGAAASFAIFVYCVGAASVSLYAVMKAPALFHTPGFRKRWKFLMMQMRPSVYWWMIVAIIKGVYLSLTTVFWDSPMSQTIWLGSGLLFYFLAVFTFLPWRSKTTLAMDVMLHYAIAVLCLLMPFFVPADDDDVVQVALTFVVAAFVCFVFAFISVCGLLYVQSPQTQRGWLLTYDRDARMFVEAFQAMDDPEALYTIFSGLSPTDYDMVLQAMNILSVEMLGKRVGSRLQWREQGMLPVNADGGRGQEKVIWY